MPDPINKNNTDNNWYLAGIRPNSSRIACENLSRQRFQIFMPLEQITIRNGSTFKAITRPLFAGYIFVLLHANQGPWRQVNSTRGVTRLISFGGYPRAVPHLLVEELMARCDSSGILQSPKNFAAGDTVSITTGPFAGFVSTIQAISPEERAYVLIDIMGRETRVSVPVTAARRV